MSDAPNLPDDFLTDHLATIARMLALIPTQQLEDHVNWHSHHLSMHDAMGPILHPSEYRDNLQSGRYDDARNQLEIVRGFLAVRQLIDKREAFVQQLKQKKGQS